MRGIKPIRTKADHREVVAEWWRLRGSRKGSPAADRCEILAAILDAYERKRISGLSLAKALTVAERKLTAQMLRYAARHFANHGCNDFDLVEEGKLTPKESCEIRKVEFNRYLGSPDLDPKEAARLKFRRENHQVLDFAYLYFLADRVEEEGE